MAASKGPVIRHAFIFQKPLLLLETTLKNDLQTFLKTQICPSESVQVQTPAFSPKQEPSQHNNKEKETRRILRTKASHTLIIPVHVKKSIRKPASD